MIKLMRYAGAKDKFTHIINPEINKSNKSIYVEPFLGSGAVFFNLEKQFDKYILNDSDRNIICIFNAFKETNYEYLRLCIDSVLESFGDIKNDKESYYNFRNTFNKTHWKKNTVKEGIYLWILYGCCLNSLARFGPNGFNQSFGKRAAYNITEEDFNNIKNRLQNTIIYNLDFFDLVEEIEERDCFIFLDPPYIERPAGYKTISDSFFVKFMSWCKFTKADILYTDIDHDFLHYQKITIREQMQNISPNRKEEYTKKEIMFINYEN